MRTLQAGAIYFLLVFAVGWVLGPIRELWLVPHLGRTMGSLLEAPLIVMIAMILAAGWVLRRLNVPYALNARLAVGLVALGILLVAELAGVRWVRGISIQEYLTGYATPSGLISLLLFLLFAAMPSLVERSKTHSPTGGCDAPIGLGLGGTVLSARMCHHDCVGDELGRVEEYNVVGKPSRRGARLVKMEAKQRWQASMTLVLPTSGMSFTQQI